MGVVLVEYMYIDVVDVVGCVACWITASGKKINNGIRSNFSLILHLQNSISMETMTQSTLFSKFLGNNLHQFKMSMSFH